MMGVQLMEEARLHGTKKFVAIGLAWAYPTFAWVAFSEDHLWDGHSEEGFGQEGRPYQ